MKTFIIYYLFNIIITEEFTDEWDTPEKWANLYRD